MNFSEDPLAELLSDNSLNNDNFFDTPTAGAVKKLGKSSKAKGKLEDLFGIKEESEPDAQSSTAANPVKTSTPRIVKQKPSLSMDDADDDLGFDPKHPKSGNAARRNLFDDFLVVADTKKNIFDDIIGNTEGANKRPATSKPSMSRQSTDSTTDNSNVLSQGRPKTAVGTGRRSSGSVQSTNIHTDHLGLFNKDKETHANVSGLSTPVSKKRGTADWLGLGVEMAVAQPTEDELERAASPSTPKHTKDVSLLAKNDTNINPDIPDPDEPQVEAKQSHSEVQATDTTAHAILMLNALNMESSHSYSALQQQEAQLKIVGQMKSQERVLLDMQQRQETQDRKFQALLQQQLQRQLQMEENIRAQQERINMHLQLMMKHPLVAPTAVSSTPRTEPSKDQMPTGGAASGNDCKEQVLQLETDVKRYTLEKQRLEELVANMRVNYEQEIEMIESSYKKQIKVLEQHLATVEERLKLENSEMRDYYIDKMEKLKVDYDLQISNLKQDHEDNLRILRSSHDADMERIRQAKILEQTTVRDHGSYVETLRMASSDLQELRESLSTTKEREQQLEMRERRLADAERRLKIDEEGAEQEKRRLMELVSTLEQQLTRLSKETAEENWQLRLRIASIDSEKKAFEKEKQFHREQMERNENRIEELKSLQLAEIERMHLEIQQERTRFLVEQQKIEMQQKLQEPSDLERDRMELEAQVQVARDAIKQANDLRDRLQKQQRELEQRTRLLLDKENALNIKEDELLQATNTYRLSIKRLLSAEHKAREAEQLLRSKLQLLGKRSHELSEKEAQFSQERMLLTQDRISLQKMREKITQGKCTLCKMGIENVEFSQRMAANDNGARALNQLPYKNEIDHKSQLENISISQAALHPTDVVDRMLDENIEASYRRIFDSTENVDLDYWTTVGLDDDSKKLVLDNGNTLDIEDMMLANLNNR